MRITLLFPPQWTTAQPYYALTTLNGQLRKAGHQVSIYDLNLGFVEYVLSPQIMNLSMRRLSSERQFLEAEVMLRLAQDDHSKETALLSDKLLAIDRYLESSTETMEALATEAPKAADMLRSPEAFYDPKSYLHATWIVDQALKLFSMPFYPYDVRWNDFYNPLVSLNLQPILDFCADTKNNPFHLFYKKKLKEIWREESELIALSINSFSQVLPGLTLAFLLKEERDKRAQSGQQIPHLSLGGNFFSRLKDALLAQPKFFQAFGDTMVIGEGEKPLVELAKALEEATDSKPVFKSVPSLLYYEETAETVHFTFDAPNYSMEEMAIQDLAGLPLDRYLSPEKVLCLRASKGCYWGKCTFCDAPHGLQMDKMSIERLVEEIRYLRDTYGIRHFEFVDQCISPSFMELMCDAFLEADLQVHWFCNGRTESGFTPELMEKMHLAGNTMVMWGVESASERLLKLMRKGISTSHRMSILQNASDAGLWNFAYVFFGFPTETRDEAVSTIDLIRNHIDIIHSYGRSVFSLGKHSPLMQHPEQYGILEYVEDNQEFSTNLSFKVADGIQGQEVSEMAQLCTSQCREAYGDPLWMALRSRETLHLYLAHHGKQYVQNFHLDQMQKHNHQAEFVF